MLKIIKNLANFLAAFIFPKSCFICNQIIADGYFCTHDFNKLQFLSKPACQICFYPFEFKIDDDITCPKCLSKRPSYFKATSILKYDQNSKILITKLKYADHTYMAKYFANLIYNYGQEILKSDIDFIIPVPLHKIRLADRKYNQSALIARYLAKLTNITLVCDLLIRTKNTISQTSLNHKLRSKNIYGAFALNEKYKKDTAGKNILLIDDVITSGATIQACSQTLMKAKATKVYVLTLAKTVLD